MEDDGRSVDGIYYLDFWDGDGSRSGVERAAEGSRGQQRAADGSREQQAEIRFVAAVAQFFSWPSYSTSSSS